MNLYNEHVTHKSFGEGSVVDFSDSRVKVRFPSGVRKFLFPDAFGTHLMLADPSLAKEVEKMKRKVFRKREKREQELERKRAIQEAKRQRRLERERILRNYRISPASQAVFWCDPEEQKRIFEDWEVFTSRRKTGAREGLPNRLVRLHYNSCCLITERASGVSEGERRIVGFFMVDELFVGKLCEDGYVPAHPEYRMKLTDEESEKLLFWNYYINQRYPDRMTWNSGRHRYFENIWMAQILQKVIELKKGTSDEQLARRFLEYFLEANRLVESNIPKPNGALIYQKESEGQDRKTAVN